MTLNKNANLTIYVGGQNGYNGGGETSDIYGNGGGATDIRLESSETSKRIIVQRKPHVLRGVQKAYSYDEKNPLL